MPSPWDALLARRTAIVSCAILGLAAVVVVGTDEVSSTWASRFARLCVLSPVGGGLAAALVSQQARRRGELVALAASGCSPWTATRGTVIGASLLPLMAASSLAAHIGALGALFPVLASSPFRLQGSAFAAASAGVRIEQGHVTFLPPDLPTELHASPRAPLALLVLVTAFVVPAWCVAPIPLARRVVVGALAALSAVVAFHVVAAGAAAFWLLAPALPLALDLLFARTWRNPLPRGGNDSTVSA